jgi:hypothetical protein
MADKKISALTASTTPLAGTEVLPIVQSGSTVKVAVSNLTAGRSVGMQQANIAAAAGGGFVNPAFIADDGTGAARIVFLGAPYAGVPANKPWLHSYQDIYVGSDAGTTFNVISGGTKTLGVDGSGNATVTGNFVVGTAGKGIDFSANTASAGMTSELLDWYEEGTWAIADVSGAGLSLTVDHAKYTRVGNLVTINAYVTYPVTANTSSATLSLPFAAAAYDLGSAGASNGAVFSIVTTGGTNAMSLRSSSLVSLTNAAVSGTNVLISFTYMV